MATQFLINSCLESAAKIRGLDSELRAAEKLVEVLTRSLMDEQRKYKEIFRIMSKQKKWTVATLQQYQELIGLIDDSVVVRVLPGSAAEVVREIKEFARSNGFKVYSTA